MMLTLSNEPQEKVRRVWTNRHTGQHETHAVSTTRLLPFPPSEMRIRKLDTELLGINGIKNGGT